MREDLDKPDVDLGQRLARLLRTATGHVAAAWLIVWLAGLPGWGDAVVVAAAAGIAGLRGWLGWTLFSFGVRSMEEDERKKGIGRADDVPAWVEEDVRAMARLSGVPHPEVALLDSRTPTCLAMTAHGSRGLIHISKGALDLLDRAEIRAVAAHEFSHVRHRDTLVQAVLGLLTAVAATAAMAFAHRVAGSGVAGASAVLLGALLAAAALRAALSRRCEYRCDRDAARLSGDPAALASALRKIHVGLERASASPGPLDAALAALFDGHPALRQRIARLERLADRLTRQRARERAARATLRSQ